MDNSKIINWLKEEEQIGSEKSSVEKERVSYDKKIVAWLDILGIREKIKDEKKYDAEAIIYIMSSLTKYIKEYEEYFAKGVMSYSQIADGVMLVADIEYANKVCAMISEIQWKILINLKMLSRGAITVGNVSVTDDGSLIIGPAYVEAYALESENSIYARTIVSDAFVVETKSYLSFKYLKKDFDSIYFLDYVDYIIDTLQMDIKKMTKHLKDQGVFEELRKNSSVKNDKLSVRQKHGWTLELLEKNNIKLC